MSLLSRLKFDFRQWEEEDEGWELLSICCCCGSPRSLLNLSYPPPSCRPFRLDQLVFSLFVWLEISLELRRTILVLVYGCLSDRIEQICPLLLLLLLVLFSLEIFLAWSRSLSIPLFSDRAMLIVDCDFLLAPLLFVKTHIHVWRQQFSVEFIVYNALSLLAVI